MTAQQPGAPPFLPPTPLDPWAMLHSVRDTLDRAARSTPTSREVFHRAVSTAYYALFHALARNNADNIVGAPINPSMALDWIDAYRRMRHGFAANQLQRHMFTLDVNGRALSGHFINLKIARETADYNPDAVFNLASARQWLNRATAALNILQAMSQTDKRTITNIVLYGQP